jgi:hypothetical protein
VPSLFLLATVVITATLIIYEMPKPAWSITSSYQRRIVRFMTGKVRKIGKKGRKRSKSEIAQDRALVAEGWFKGGLTDQEIADELNARDGVNYTLTRRMISYEREKIVTNYQKAHKNADANFWIEEAVMRTYMVEAAAWKGWESSLLPRERKIVRSGYHGDADFEQVEELVENNIGDKGFLKIILDAISQRNKLRGIGATRLSIEQRTEHVIKTYAIVSPQDWDDPNIIPGEYTEQEALPSGSD